MKLEEQFDKLIPIEFGGEMNPLLRDGCVEIAENFAIGFAEWLPSNAYKESVWRMYDKGDNSYTIQELLDKYKETL